ncbi:MAG: tetratricopeptide repeat protein [Cypionkella sp.]
MRISAIALVLALGLGTLPPPAWAQTAAVVAPDAVDAEAFSAIGAQALADVQRRADAGDAGAALILSRVLLASDKTPAQIKEGLERLQAAAAAGLPEALTRWADILAAGQFGLQADPAKAAELYAQGADKGDNGARRGLANLLIAGKGVSHDAESAVALLEAAIATGDLSAATQLAGLYARGLGLAQDAAKARDLFSLGVLANNNGALNGLGDMYRGAVPPAPGQALAIYRQAANNGDNSAQKKLADMLVKGEGTPADFASGAALLEQMVQRNDVSGLVALGDYYLRGIGVTTDAVKAAQLYERAATAPNAAAMVKLAQLYRSGAAGFARDLSRARDWYGQAASAGDAGSRRMLAEMQARGEGVSADLPSAIATLQQLGNGGDIAALVLAGDLYARGEVTAPDPAKAMQFYQSAAAAGNAGGLIRLGDLYRTGISGLDPDPEKAAGYYEQAIALGDNGARRNLSALLLAGAKGLEADAERATSLLQEAADLGDASASQQLGVMLANGDPLPANYQRAMAAFDRSVQLGNAGARVRQGVMLVNGPLAADHAKEGMAMLRQAAMDNLPGAPVELARLQVAAETPDGGLDAALKTLQPAIDANDSGAIRYLIGVYRDGAKDKIKPQPEQAMALIAEKASVLGPEIVALESILVAASQPATTDLFKSVTADFALLTPPNAINAMQRLRGNNANAYVYILQAALAERGLYDGALNGTLTGQTIGALQQFCAAESIKRECDRGPLTSEAAVVLARALSLPRQPTAI